MTIQKIGRYEIKSELGRGGMATVYKAYDPRFEREVALKVLPREMLHDPQFRVRFEREAKTIAALEHPAIVPVYDVGEEDGQPYFVMRYMTGGSLADKMKNGPLSIQDVASIIQRLAPALDDAHAKGIVHRDLKPANILFDRGGEPYISDFGIAKISQASGGTVTGGNIIGTPAYMSPEQAQGDSVDGRSDIYALGIIVYELLSGQQPYQADTPMAIVVKHITEPIPHILDIAPTLPAAIEVIIERAMAKNRDERFSTSAEFSAALGEVSRGASAEDAFKTASIAATRIQANSKTRVSGKASGPTRVGAKPNASESDEKEAAPQKAGLALPALIGVIVVIVALLGLGGFLAASTLMAAPPSPTPLPVTPTSSVLVNIPEPSPSPETALPTAEPTLEPTAQPEPTVTTAPTQPASLPGGADKIAFIANNNVWIMNLDGTELTQLTTDNAPKSSLQWMSDNRTLVFISGRNVNTVESDTLRFDTIASFPYADSIDAFRISPDGKTVAMGLNKEMYIIPLDLEKLRTARGKSDLIAMKGCLQYTGATRAAVAVRDFRWADDNTRIAWLFRGVSAGNPYSVDLFNFVDISACDPTKIKLLDEFPGTRFTMEGYSEKTPFIPGYDFDGVALFLLNSSIRNDGWGFLYTYNLELQKPGRAPLFPAGPNTCCYRDPRWSPDKSYILVAYQDRAAAASAETQLFYFPYLALDAGATLTPITMPPGFFKNPKESLQPALRPAQP